MLFSGVICNEGRWDAERRTWENGFFLEVWVRAPPPLLVLWPFLCHGSRGSWCRASDIIIHRSRGAGQGAWRGSTFASSTIPFSCFPGLAVELLESQFTGSLTQRPGWDRMWPSDKTQREHIWYQLASEQDREIHICTVENSDSQSQS